MILENLKAKNSVLNTNMKTEDRNLYLLPKKMIKNIDNFSFILYLKLLNFCINKKELQKYMFVYFFILQLKKVLFFLIEELFSKNHYFLLISNIFKKNFVNFLLQKIYFSIL